MEGGGSCESIDRLSIYSYRIIYILLLCCYIFDEFSPASLRTMGGGGVSQMNAYRLPTTMLYQRIDWSL